MSKKEKLQEKAQQLEEKYHSIECSLEWYFDSHQDAKAQQCFAKLQKVEAKIKEVYQQVALIDRGI